MSDLKNPWVAVVIVGGFISNLYFLWTRKRGHDAVTRWADEQGFTIVELSRRFFVPIWRADLFKRNQYFRFSLRDKQGNVRLAWIRCYPYGLTNPDSVEVEVIWDEK
jgi:hypothetical protein